MSISPLPGSALANSVLVVAHPDDEILWFGSVVADVSHIIVCFLDDPDSPDLGSARKRSLPDLPYRDRTTFLGLPETGTFNEKSWLQPETTSYGLKITGIEGGNEVYEARARELGDALEPLIRDADNVFTHNPWGEYGHAEHVMVHRIVMSITERSGAAVWHSNYVSRWSQPLMENYLANSHAEYHQNDVDTATMLEMSKVYRRHGAWTWASNYAWFPQECYIRGPLSAVDKADGGWLFPLNYIRTSGLGKPAHPAKTSLLTRLQRKLARIIRRTRAPGRNGN